MSEVLGSVLGVSSLEAAERLSRAYAIAEGVKECPGCSEGKITVELNDGGAYRVPCRLLERRCRYGQDLGKRLDARAKGNVRSLPGLPTRFYKPLEDPRPTAAVRGVNTWKQEGFLLLHGDHGTGKSFAAAYALYLLARQALLAHWKHPSAWGALSAMWTNAYRVTSKDDVFEAARVVPVLVIDDLGGEEPTNRAKGRIVEVVSERYNQRKITVLTTNADSLELEKIYGRRMSDRVLGDGLTVHCGGESLRLAV